MRKSVNGIDLKTEDIKEMKIGQTTQRGDPVYNVYAVMKSGKKIFIGTEYKIYLAIALANSCKPNSFVYTGDYK